MEQCRVSVVTDIVVVSVNQDLWDVIDDGREREVEVHRKSRVFD